MSKNKATQSSKLNATNTAKGNVATEGKTGDKPMSVRAQLEANKGKPEADSNGRMPYYGLKVDDKGNATVKLTEVPKDFNRALNRPLRKDDFEQEHVFLRMKADEAQAEATKLYKRAEISEKMGSSEHGKSIGKIVKMQSSLKDEIAKLKAEGVDVEALLAELTGDSENDAE